MLVEYGIAAGGVGGQVAGGGFGAFGLSLDPMLLLGLGAAALAFLWWVMR